MLTAGQLARRCGMSRTALLYYERQGLIGASSRGANGYRYYGPEAEAQLRRILAYRDFGLPVGEIRALLEQGDDDSAIMQRHFMRLEGEIQALRKQQNAIVHALGQTGRSGRPAMDKDRWVGIMRAAGLSDADMQQWHREFERLEPEGHAAFLRSLGCSRKEIARIRKMSAAEVTPAA